jgi:hypothetical protein
MIADLSQEGVIIDARGEEAPTEGIDKKADDTAIHLIEEGREGCSGFFIALCGKAVKDGRGDIREATLAVAGFEKARMKHHRSHKEKEWRSSVLPMGILAW